jgi:hypothetical protein
MEVFVTLRTSHAMAAISTNAVFPLLSIVFSRAILSIAN